MSESPRPPRLGRESTPLMLPKSHRVKKKRRSGTVWLLLYSVLALFLLAAAAAFVARDRITKRFFPPPKMVEGIPKSPGPAR